MSRHCRGCGVSIDDRPKNHFLCLRCYADAARRLKAGGITSSVNAELTCSDIGFTSKRLEQLIKLAHPDKHGGDPVANDAVKWLLSLRKTLKDEGRHYG